MQTFLTFCLTRNWVGRAFVSQAIAYTEGWIPRSAFRVPFDQMDITLDAVA